MKNITVEKLINLINSKEKLIIIDVRSINEYNNLHIKGSINYPLEYLIAHHTDIIPEYQQNGFKIILYCNLGIKSAKAITILEDFSNDYDLINLQGGITEWIKYLED